MKKEARELLRMARNAGWRNVKIENGGAHARLIGSIGGRDVCRVVSLSKAFATTRNMANLMLDLRKMAAEASE